MEMFTKFMETLNEAECKLSELAKENQGKSLDYKELDKPITESKSNIDSGDKVGLTDVDKKKIQEETSWSDEIVNSIDSMEEYEIYKEAGLIEGEVNGKTCLMRTDIDWNLEYMDAFTKETKTNGDRVKEGLSPLDKNGKPIELHHIGQHADSPLAELTFQEHRCGGNDTILHDKTKKTEVHGEGNKWDAERQEYWKDRELNEGGK